jgi:hypothetical protein
MDVSLFRARVSIALSFFLVAIWLGSLSGCGNRFNLDTDRGRRASIDEANYRLSRGECSLAAAAINPLYGSSYVDDEVRIIKASTLACVSRFAALTMISQLAANSNVFQGLALSLDNTAGDGAPTNFYSAIDILTQAGTMMNGTQRGSKVNTYMVFLQLGTIASIIRNYGSPSATGTQGVDMTYPGQLSNPDGCALAAALSFIEDSYAASDLNDATTRSALTALTNICVTAMGGSCSAINRNRTVCDGANAQSLTATAVVNAINVAW